MLWLICIILSVVCLVAAPLFCLGTAYGWWAKKCKIYLFRILFAAVIVASFIMFLPINTYESPGGVWGAVRTFFLSLFTTMQLFGLGCEYEIVKDALIDCPKYLSTYYQVWSSVLFFLAPVFTFGFALSFFKNVIAHLKYYIRFRGREAYVFSELNERSVALAKSIKENKDKAKIPVALIFTDVFETNDEVNFELMDQIKKLGAISFKNDILVINFGIHSPQRALSFFMIGEDQTENLNQTLKLVEKYRERERTNVYFFSTNVQSEILLSALDKGKVKARRINEVRSLINRVLYENGEIFFDIDQKDVDGLKHISALIVGMGQHGTEMVKALSWFCQMDGYSFEINAFDKDPKAGEKFIQQVPELVSDEYKINVYSDFDVDSDKFTTAVSQLANTTYVWVALGNDDINIRTAVFLRTCFERIGKKPIIQAIVYNTQQKCALQNVRNFKGVPYNIDFIGDLDTSYSEEVILNSALESEALRVHMSNKDSCEEHFWAYEYNYRSSMASAIHKRARIKCNIPGADKLYDDLTLEERDLLERLEHRRWNAYMRSEGYIYSGSDDPASRNDLGKMHHNLTHFNSLSEEDKRKDSHVAAK